MTYGQHTTDEMAELWLQVVTRNPADRARLARAARERIVREEIVGVEKRLETDPDNAALHDDVALLHAEAGHVDRTAEHFAHTVRVRPDSAAAHYNLGNALFRQGRRAEAIESLRKALTLDPDYALAHDGLGVALYSRGRARRSHRALPARRRNSTRATWTRALTWRSRFDNCWPSIRIRRSSRESWSTSSVRSRLNADVRRLEEPQSRAKEEICPGDS